MTTQQNRLPALLQFVLLTALLVYGATTAFATPTPTPHIPNLEALQASAVANGRVRVIVSLDVDNFAPEGLLDSPTAVDVQRDNIEAAQSAVLAELAGLDTVVLARYRFIPAMALSVDAEALDALATLPNVAALQEDIPEPPALSSSIPIIGADDAWAAGYTGEGTVVAVLDSGVDKTHPFFSTGGQKIVSEACYSTNNPSNNEASLCPGGVITSTAENSGLNCDPGIAGCDHGTHVAGIVAGNDGVGPHIGVAPDANLIAIQVFTKIGDSAIGSYPSDQLLALERVYELRHTYNIVAVNMSLGGNPVSTYCDSDSRKQMFDNLVAANIAVVVASGNNGDRDGISTPACISSAVSVGNTTDGDDIAATSNVADFLDLLAPGTGVISSVPGGGISSKSGTSMAAPHVAGAWAVMREASPAATVNQLLTILQDTGASVDDQRSGGVVTDMRRINLDEALQGLTLTLQKTVNTAVAYPGDTLTYTLVTRNASPLVTTNTILTDTLPAHLTLQPASLSGDATYDGTGPGNTITWTLGALNAGQTLTRTFTAVIDNPPASYGLITNTAVLTSSTTTDNITSSASTTIGALAACGYNETFESGTLPPFWITYTDNDGRVRVANTTPAAHSGSYALYLDDAVDDSTNSHAAAILSLDLTGAVNPQLSFWWRETTDENHDADGVFLSEDGGQTWHPAFSFNDGPQSYTQTILNLEQAASAAGLNGNGRILVKFQFYDNYSIDLDGYIIDDVQLECANAAVYLPFIIRP